MMKGHVVAAALAAGLLMAPAAQHAPSFPTAAQPAGAVPLAQVDVAKGHGVRLVKRGRGGGRRSFGGGGGRKFGGRGGGRRSFGGGGGRKFSGGGRRKFGGFRGRRSFRGGPRLRFGKRHRRRSRIYYYAPYVPYYYYSDYGYYYDDDCEWLRQKALRTDSSYWWRRYDRCING